jgi:formate dehydrogenase iron-sulfur subunit
MPLSAFSIDLDRCIGCQACTVACNAGNERTVGDYYIGVHDIVTGQMPAFFGTFAHHRCFHCSEAACVAVCPTGTLTKTDTGMTAVDQAKCSGCGYCTQACPYKVPNLVNGRVSKCVACLDVVQSGDQPYCVQTCPSKAIKFGDRQQLLADAQTRVAALKTRYPRAQVYGESQLGGLGLIMVLLDEPGVYGLPVEPAVTTPVKLWQGVVQPLTMSLAALSVVVTGFAYVAARREHGREKAALHAQDTAATSAPETVAPMETGPAPAADVAAPTEWAPAAETRVPTDPDVSPAGPESGKEGEQNDA